MTRFLGEDRRDIWSNTWLMWSLAPISHPLVLTLHPFWLLIAAWGGRSQFACCLPKAPLLTAYLWPGLFAVIGQMGSISPWKASAASVTDLSRSRTQVHRQYKCGRVFWETAKRHAITHLGGPPRAQTCQRYYWIWGEIFFNGLVLT